MEKKTYTLVGIIVLLIVIIGFFTIRNEHANIAESAQKVHEKAQEVATPETATPEAVLELTEYDVVIGNPDAPVTIYEYLSYTCLHCADFAAKVYPLIKEEYIDKGLVKIIMRDFPLDEPGLRAAQLTRCIAKDKYEALHKALLKNRMSWAYVKDFPEKLENIAKLSGMSGEEFHYCMENKEIEDYILTGRLNASDAFMVSSTPTVIINGVKNIKGNDFANIKIVIEELLNKNRD